MSDRINYTVHEVRLVLCSLCLNGSPASDTCRTAGCSLYDCARPERPLWFQRISKPLESTTCRPCNGSGQIPNHPQPLCPYCNGGGEWFAPSQASPQRIHDASTGAAFDKLQIDPAQDGPGVASSIESTIDEGDDDDDDKGKLLLYRKAPP